MSKKRIISEDLDELSGTESYDSQENRPSSSGAKRKKAYWQSFRSEWLADPEMKCWLVKKEEKDGENECAFCKMCNCTMNPKLSVLRCHMKTKKHQALTHSAQGSNKVSLRIPY